MHVSPIAAVSVATLTWAGFAVGMRYYFRGARRRTRAKTWLTLSAGACTLAQIVAVAAVGPPNDRCAWAGIACYALANVLYWWALAVHGKARPAFAFLPVAPTTFTQTGPYRVVRHPIYSAYLLAWLAAPVLTGLPWLLLPLGGMWLFYYRAARQEEKQFATTPFAPAYGAYQKRTGMFLPKLIRGVSEEGARRRAA